MRIVYWADFACPYCYIGAVRLRKAMAALGKEAEIETEMRAFQLDPDAPLVSEEGTLSRMVKKYALTYEEAKKHITEISAMAKGEGLDFRYDTAPFTNTMDAHRLMKNESICTGWRGVHDLLAEQVLIRHMDATAEMVYRSNEVRFIPFRKKVAAMCPACGETASGTPRQPDTTTFRICFRVPPTGLKTFLYVGIMFPNGMIPTYGEVFCAMHIPENYLSPSTCGVMGAVMVPVWLLSLRKVRETVPRERLPLLGVAAAFSFLAMMFNIPLPSGTTGHAVGGTLIAILFGPYAACLAVSVALFIQVLFFGDGGLLSFGANCFNMAFVLPFAGWLVYQAVQRLGASRLVAAGLGSYIGINGAALCAAIEFGIQPMLFTDAAGQALYAPYPLWVSVPAMMLGHLTLFGLAEVVFTVGVLAYIERTSPALLGEAAAPVSHRPLMALIAALIVATPLGLLAAGTAWGEWDGTELAETDFFGTALGYTPAGMAQGFSYEALMPDYAVAGLPDAFGYIVSAVVGVALLMIVFKLFAACLPARLPSE